MGLHLPPDLPPLHHPPSLPPRPLSLLALSAPVCHCLPLSAPPAESAPSAPPAFPRPSRASRRSDQLYEARARIDETQEQLDALGASTVVAVRATVCCGGRLAAETARIEAGLPDPEAFDVEGEASGGAEPPYVRVRLGAESLSSMVRRMAQHGHLLLSAETARVRQAVMFEESIAKSRQACERMEAARAEQRSIVAHVDAEEKREAERLAAEEAEHVQLLEERCDCRVIAGVIAGVIAV